MRIDGLISCEASKPVPLRPDVSELQHHILGKFPLNGEIVLRGVLRPHMRLEFTEKSDGPEPMTIHRLTRA